jgi:hypothetical protein
LLKIEDIKKMLTIIENSKMQMDKSDKNLSSSKLEKLIFRSFDLIFIFISIISRHLINLIISLDNKNISILNYYQVISLGLDILFLIILSYFSYSNSKVFFYKYLFVYPIIFTYIDLILNNKVNLSGENQKIYTKLNTINSIIILCFSSNLLFDHFNKMKFKKNVFYLMIFKTTMFFFLIFLLSFDFVILIPIFLLEASIYINSNKINFLKNIIININDLYNPKFDAVNQLLKENNKFGIIRYGKSFNFNDNKIMKLVPFYFLNFFNSKNYKNDEVINEFNDINNINFEEISSEIKNPSEIKVLKKNFSMNESAGFFLKPKEKNVFNFDTTKIKERNLIP